MEKGARTKEIAGIRRLYSTEAFAEHFLDENELPLQDALDLIDRFKEITDTMDNLVLDEAKAKLDVSKASVSSVNRVLRENGLTPESFTQQISELANSVGESFAEVTKGNEFQQKLNQTKKLQDDVNKNLGLYNKFAEAERTRLSETLEQLQKDREAEAAKDYANLRYVEMLDVEILKTETALNSLNKDFANFQTEMEKASVVAAEWSKEAEKIATESQQQFRDFWSSYKEKETQKYREEAGSRYIEFAQKTGTLQAVLNETLSNLNKVNDHIYQSETRYLAAMEGAFSSSGIGGSFVTEEESGWLNSEQRHLERLIGERDYLENLADQIKQAAGGLQTSVLGSFSAAALDRMSGASISAEERTAKATEATAKGINRLHRDFGTLQDAYVLGY
jgi:chromosome segregation ATPase